MLFKYISNSLAGRLLGIPPVCHSRLKYPQVRTIDGFLKTFASDVLFYQHSSSLDLGCGSKPKNPFACPHLKGVDFQSYGNPDISECDLSRSPLPFLSSSFDGVTAYDLIEHIPRIADYNGSSIFPFVDLMNEIYRVLRPGGYFFSKTPAYPFSQAFVDPTHVNIITEDTFPVYFCRSNHLTPEACRYGFVGSFELVRQSWWGGGWLLTLLRKS